VVENQNRQEDSAKEQWPDNVAKKIIEAKGDLPEYTVAAGITPSGVVHIGNFREIMTVDLVARALRKLGKKVRFIYSWDDYDVFRKVPANFPNREMLEKYMRQPIVDVPDPFIAEDGKPCHASYAEHNEKVLEQVLPALGISPQFLYQAKKYRACEYAEGMKKALLKKDEIKKILDEWRADDLEGEWNPVRVFCEKCNTDRTTITAYDNEYSLTYSCECGHSGTFDFRKKGIAKLQWRVDWPMRWDFEKVRFEPSGKEHSSQGGSNTTANEIVRLYGFEPPYHIMYEFIAIKGTGGKMSSSKGNTVDLKEMMSIYEPSVIRYLFVRPIPSKSFEISFDADVITFYEAFDRVERIYFGAEPAKENPIEQVRGIYEFSAVELPKALPFQPSFRHITNVLQLKVMDEEKTFGYFKKGAGRELGKFDENRLATRISCAKNWLANYAPEQFIFRVQGSVSDAALSMPQGHKEALLEFAQSVANGGGEEQLSEAFKAAAEKRKIPLADLFKSAYLLLVNKERGPKLFHIIENIGPAKVIALAGELAEKKAEKKQRLQLPGAQELAKSLDFEISDGIRAKYPSLRIGLIVISSVDNSKTGPAIAGLLRAEESEFKKKYFGKDISSISGIKAWREAYSAFGAKPKDFKSSIEALAKRVLKGEQLPSINPLVDLYNYISIKYVLPVGGEDLSRIKGAIRLRFAEGTEQFCRIGSDVNEPPEKGEVIYADDIGVLCRRFNWREADRTKLTEKTKKAVLVIESLNNGDPLEEAITELAALVQKYCGAKVGVYALVQGQENATAPNGASAPKGALAMAVPNNTKLLFIDDPYLKEAKAKVRAVDGSKIYLDQTIFFAFSGGQKSDRGEINGMDVSDVVFEGDDLAHIIEGNKFRQGQEVSLKIDWKNRFNTMRLHSASHIVDHFVKQVKGSNEMSGSLVDAEKDRSTYIMAQKLTPEEITKIEKLTNDFLAQGKPIVRRRDKGNPNILHWDCENIHQLCSGTHVSNTSEIGKIKLKRSGKGAGKELVETYLEKY